MVCAKRLPRAHGCGSADGGATPASAQATARAAPAHARAGVLEVGLAEAEAEAGVGAVSAEEAGGRKLGEHKEGERSQVLALGVVAAVAAT